MFALVLTVGVLTAIALRLPLGALPEAVARLGPLAPVVGVVVGAALLVALIPRTPISLACGLLFGAALGAVCALLIALTAAAVTFAAGRWLGRDFVVRHLLGHAGAAGRVGAADAAGAGRRRRRWVRLDSRRWARLEEWVTREGVLAVAAVRALPIGPYGLGGYVYGTSGVRVRDYALGTLIAGAPSAVSYALLGAAVASPGPLAPVTLVPLGFGPALSVAVLLRARVVARRRSRTTSHRRTQQPRQPARSRSASWPGRVRKGEWSPGSTRASAPNRTPAVRRTQSGLTTASAAQRDDGDRRPRPRLQRGDLPGNLPKLAPQPLRGPFGELRRGVRIHGRDGGLWLPGARPVAVADLARGKTRHQPVGLDGLLLVRTAARLGQQRGEKDKPSYRPVAGGEPFGHHRNGQPAGRVAHQDHVGVGHRRDAVERVDGDLGVLLGARARILAGQVGGHDMMAAATQLVGEQVPAPRTVPCPVDEAEGGHLGNATGPPDRTGIASPSCPHGRVGSRVHRAVGQTTTLTIRPGTTMTFRGSRPSSACATSASAAARTSSSSGRRRDLDPAADLAVDLHRIGDRLGHQQRRVRHRERLVRQRWTRDPSGATAPRPGAGRTGRSSAPAARPAPGGCRRRRPRWPGWSARSASRSRC